MFSLDTEHELPILYAPLLLFPWFHFYENQLAETWNFKSQLETATGDANAVITSL